jgi:hypothetical protein
VSADPPSDVAAAAEQLHGATTVNELLSRTAESFVLVLDAQACTISRVIGDLLVDLVQHQRGGKPNRLGHGYLISDYPLTRAVIENREPQTVHTDDSEADQAEIDLLAELEFEVYGNGRRFGPDDVGRAQALAAEAGAALERLSRPPQ